MVEEERQPTKDPAPQILDELLLRDGEIDDATAARILQLVGVDRETSLQRLKAKFEAKVQAMEREGLEVPPALLKIIGIPL